MIELLFISFKVVVRLAERLFQPLCNPIVEPLQGRVAFACRSEPTTNLRRTYDEPRGKANEAQK